MRIQRVFYVGFSHFRAGIFTGLSNILTVRDRKVQHRETRTIGEIGGVGTMGHILSQTCNIGVDHCSARFCPS